MHHITQYQIENARHKKLFLIEFQTTLKINRSVL